MRSVLLLAVVSIAACLSLGHASLVVREVEERLSEEELRAELGLGTDALPVHALAQVDLSAARARRDAGEKIPMTIDVLGRTITVDLAPNRDLLPTSYVLQTVGEDGTLHTVPSHIRRDCYYTGRVEGSEGSHVAVEICKDYEMTCMIMSEGQAVVVKPMKNSSLHLVYDVTNTILSGDPADGVESARPLGNARRVAKSLRADVGSQVPVIETMELMVYVDKQTADFYGGKVATEAYVTNMLNTVASLYNDPSLLGPPVHIALVRLVVETSSTSPITSSANLALLHPSFCAYQVSASFPSDDSNPQHHDFAVLLTRRDIHSVDAASKHRESEGGVSHLSGMCNDSLSCAVVHDIGYASGFALAHEAGHAFSMKHDGEMNRCNPIGNVMATKLTFSSDLFKWSTCSARYLEQFRERGLTNCLHDIPGGNVMVISATSLPGRKLNFTEQCKTTFGSTSIWHNRSQTTDEVCGKMWCTLPHNLLQSTQPLQGTRCDTGKSCFDGKCVADSLLNNPINGNWSAWSSWSSCSRTCGGGVRTRTRQCNNPAPQYGGTNCDGKSSEVEYCSPNDCARDTYRNEQCAATNSIPLGGHFYTWTEYDPELAGAPPCNLVCLSNTNFQTTRGVVTDSTSCKPSNGYDKAICLHQECINVGCDNKFVGARADKCGVCSGNGTSCSQTRNTLSLQNLKNTYNYAVTIPAGARNIVIRQDPFTHNNLIALMDDKKLLLNDLRGRIPPGKSTNFRARGVSWQYRRTLTAETLSASGTLTQPAFVFILAYESGNHVRLTYEYVVDIPMPPPQPATQPLPPPTTQPTDIITGTFSATNQSSGYLSAVTIPAGARSIVIREDPVNADNFFALSAGGTRVLNANSPYRRRSNVRASGVQWKYRRNSARERLSASGTLTQAAVVEVLVGRNGSSVRFTYKYEVAASTTGMPTPRLS